MRTIQVFKRGMSVVIPLAWVVGVIFFAMDPGNLFIWPIMLVLSVAVFFLLLKGRGVVNTVPQWKEHLVSYDAETAPDYVDELHKRYIDGKPEMEARHDRARLHLQIGQRAYDLRTQAGLSEKQLAKKLEVSAQVVSSFEHGDCQDDGECFLTRIEQVLAEHVPNRVK